MPKSLFNDFQRLMQPPEDDTLVFGGARAADPLSGAPMVSEAALVSLLRSANAALVDELIGRIHSHRPEFFEHLVIDVLLAMGYGRRRADMAQRLGRSGDGGIDGLIALDELGLDLIYIQAKRLKPGLPVPISEVRDFAGSLEARHASKGVFVTTTHFSPGAVEFCSRLTRRVVLIDGMRLADLMVRYNIGVKVRQSYLVKGIDGSYFSADPVVPPLDGF